jgi:hypothetical protein
LCVLLHLTHNDNFLTLLPSQSFQCNRPTFPFLARHGVPRLQAPLWSRAISSQVAPYQGHPEMKLMDHLIVKFDASFLYFSILVPKDPGDGLKGGRFPSTIRAKKGHDLSVGNLQREASQDQDNITVYDFYVVDLQHVALRRIEGSSSKREAHATYYSDQLA